MKAFKLQWLSLIYLIGLILNHYHFILILFVKLPLYYIYIGMVTWHYTFILIFFFFVKILDFPERLWYIIYNVRINVLLVLLKTIYYRRQGIGDLTMNQEIKDLIFNQ